MLPMPGTTQGTAVPEQSTRPLRHERFLGLFATLRPGEGRSVLLCFSYAFLLLVCYYVLKTLRDALLLAGATAETKSYAHATIAAALLVIVPLYGLACRRAHCDRVMRGVTLFFVANLAVFYFLGRSGADIAFAYYVWVGVFGVAILAQFWAHAADIFDVQTGQRVFPAIMVGATLGGLAGPALARVLFGALGPWPLMLIAIAMLAATLPLVEWTRSAVPERSHSRDRLGGGVQRAPCPLGGLALVFRDRYLLLLALLVVLLNCVNTTGEYILAELVVRHTESQVAADPGLDKGALIGAFYADFYLVVNALTAFAQMFLVARVFRWIGVPGALLIVPVIALIGYGLVVFLPVFAILRCVKILENSVDYSVMNTARHALYLPLPTCEKYEGKVAIDAFFWRFGDLLQAGIIFVGLNWLGFDYPQFALLNMLLAIAWIAVAIALARRYSQRTAPAATLHARSPREVSGHFAPRRPVLAFARSAVAVLLTSALGVLTLSIPGAAKAGQPHLFDRHEVLAIDVFMDIKALCRNPNRKGCEDVPAELVYRDDAGTERHVEVSLRARGRYHEETGDCTLPALFVFFTGDTRGTLFDGEAMLPLTTHCQNAPRYEQYVLKEHLAYRIYNLLTEKSLRVRLARITYHDTAGRAKPLERYAFFTEHFESLARRHDSTVWTPERFDPLQADPTEIATHDLFQYMIGNTDWSVVYSHNIVLIRNGAGLVTPVPYDFDFSGLVGAHYASVSPELPIRNVRERLFRGVCRAETDWPQVVHNVQSRRREIYRLTDGALDIDENDDLALGDYLDTFYDVVADPLRLERNIAAACRATS